MRIALTVLILALFLNEGFCQELKPARPFEAGKSFKILKNPDGTEVRVPIQRTEEFANQVFAMQMARGGGTVARILDRLEIGDVVNLAGAELLESQREELEQLITEYRDKKEAIDELDSNGLGKLRLEYGKKVKALLLPIHLEGFKLSGYVFHDLKSDGLISKYLDLSKKQKREIERDCDLLNTEINNLLRKMEEKTKALQLKVNETLVESLSSEQRDKLQRLVHKPLDEYFDGYELKSLEYHTRMKPRVNKKD